MRPDHMSFLSFPSGSMKSARLAKKISRSALNSVITPPKRQYQRSVCTTVSKGAPLTPAMSYPCDIVTWPSRSTWNSRSQWPEAIDDRAQDRAVHLVEAVAVDVEQLQAL